jgi:hypothetical protein
VPLALLAPLACAATASAALATTTGPAPYQVGVDLSDKDAVFTYTSLPRGLSVEFDVIDDPTTKTAHTFTIFGQSTPPLVPGQHATIPVLLLHRGTFTWTSRSFQPPPPKRLPWWSGAKTTKPGAPVKPVVIHGTFSVF